MAISKEALPRLARSTHLDLNQTDDGKVARLDSFRAGRIASSFDPQCLQDEFDELTIRFEADQASLWCLINHSERPCFTQRLLDQMGYGRIWGMREAAYPR